MKCIFGLDIGGTNIKFAKFIDDELVDFYEAHTEVSEDAVSSIVSLIKNNIDSHLNGDELLGIGVAIPGPVKDGVVLGAENIGFGEVPLKEILEDVFPNVKIAILNDANSATLGEWYYGGGNKEPNMVMVTLGTGLGAGIIINNELYLGSNGSAGEVGHIKIFPFRGRPCSCGLSGCLEQYASATGIRRTAYGFRKGKHTLLNKHGRVSVRDVFDAAEQDDRVALAVLDKTAYYLAIGLSDIAATLNPDVILIGGGVSKGGKFLLEPVRKYFKEMAFSTVKDTRIELASLFNKAGCFGAYYQVKAMMK